MATADDTMVIRALQKKHGLAEEQARWLWQQLVRSRCLDIVDADTGMPVALIPGSELYEDTALEEPALVSDRERGVAD